MDDEWLHVDFRVIRQETKAAFSVVFVDNTIMWLPKKQIWHPERYRAGQRNGTMIVSSWIAKEKGMIDEGGNEAEGEGY